MSQRFQYTSMNTLLSKFHRDFRGIEFSETDAIEWVGEALGFMQVPSMQEEAVAFIEVKGYQCPIPSGLQFITQIARNNEVKEDICPTDPTDPVNFVENGGPSDPVPVDCQGNLVGDYHLAYYRPYYDLKYEYSGWSSSTIRKEKFTPIRLSNHSFFNSLVCKESEGEDIYNNDCNGDEYTIAGNQIKLSFKEGMVALAYLRQAVDPETGYPMIPDDSSAMSAITYYFAWKLNERDAWSGREGAGQLAASAEQKWLKYIRQTNNKAMMPQGVDGYQDLLEEMHYLIPRKNKYYGFFGNLGKQEARPFTDPDNRNRFSRTK